MTRPSTGIVLRGRRDELAAMATRLDAAAAGQGGALLIVGDVGTGKSALLAMAAQAEDAVVLTAAGSPSESGLAYAGLHRMLRPAAGISLPLGRTQTLVRALEAGRFGSTERAALALTALLRAGARQRRLICCIDDIHWLDEPSREVLGLVANQIGAERIVMFFAVRDDSTSVLPGVERLRLTPLDASDSRELLTDLSPGGLAGDVAAVLTAVAGGNPLALVDLATSLTAEQRRGDLPPPLTLPAESRLRREYLARLADLPEVTRRLILMLAADQHLDRRDLARAAAAGGASIDDLAPAQRLDLVRVDGDTVSFTEPVLRWIAYDSATLAQRRGAHQVLADNLDPVRQPLRQRMHRAAVAEGDDPALAGELEQAATADTVDRGVASRALERAADLVGEPAAAASYLVSAARQAWEGGEPNRARMLLRRIRPADVPANINAQAELLLGEIELRAGGTNHARQTLLAAASDLERDPQLAVPAIMRAGEATLQSGEYDNYPNLAEKALALRRDDESAANELLIEMFTGSTAVFKGRYAEGQTPLRRVIALACEIDDAAALMRGSTASMLLGDEHEALRLAIRAAAVARAAGDVASVPQALDLAAAAECALGRIDDATDTLQEALPLARATGQTSLASSLLAMLGWTAAILGDRASCMARLREARAQAASHGAVRPEAVIDYAVGVLDLVSGRPAEALVRLQNIRRRDGRGQLAIGVAATPQLVEAAVRAGERAIAMKELQRFEPWALAMDQPLWLGKAARCRALIAEDDATAEHEYRQALKYHVLDEAEFERARTELLFGQLLRRRRRPTEAREHLRWALQAFQRIGATTWIELAAGELRAAGEHEADVRAVATESLTPQQLQIARLAAAGATNREVAARMSLSPRTVDHHMRNIFARLGIHSRIELAKLLPPR